MATDISGSVTENVMETSTNSSSNKDEDDKLELVLSIEIIAGVVSGIVLLLSILVLIIIVQCLVIARNRRSGRLRRPSHPYMSADFPDILMQDPQGAVTEEQQYATIRPSKRQSDDNMELQRNASYAALPQPEHEYSTATPENEEPMYDNASCDGSSVVGPSVLSRSIRSTGSTVHHNSYDGNLMCPRILYKSKSSSDLYDAPHENLSMLSRSNWSLNLLASRSSSTGLLNRPSRIVEVDNGDDEPYYY